MITNYTQMAQKVEEIPECMYLLQNVSKNRKMDGELFFKDLQML